MPKKLGRNKKTKMIIFSTECNGNKGRNNKLDEKYWMTRFKTNPIMYGRNLK